MLDPQTIAIYASVTVVRYYTYHLKTTRSSNCLPESGASKGTPDDTKCVTEIIGGDKSNDVTLGGTQFIFLFQGNISA